MTLFVGWNVLPVVSRMSASQLLTVLVLVALVCVVSVIVALTAVLRRFCPRSQHIVYLRESDSSKTNQLSSKPETVPLVMDKIVSNNYRIEQQR